MYDYNEHERTLKLTRSEVIRIAQAVTSVKWDFLYELRDSEKDLDDEKRNYLQSSADMWADIQKKIDKQLDEQDAAD